MDIKKQVKELEKLEPNRENKVFSMYLNTDPTDPDQQGGKWKINFRNGFRNFETYLKEGDNQEELKQFQTIKKKVSNYVNENEQHLQRGIIVFATAQGDIWFADLVQLRLETEFHWQRSPVLDQLKELQQNYPKAGVILVQQDQIKVIESYLNKVQDSAFYELDINTENWRKKSGPRASHTPKGPGSSNLQMDNFEARYSANKQRWYRSIVPKLDKLAKDSNWEEVYVVGEGDASKEIKSQMNRPVDKVIQKNMLEHKDSNVLEEVFG